MANNKTKKTPTVTTTSNGNPLYHVGATGRDVDAVGQYLVNNGYMNSYSGKYDSNMQSALQNAKKDLLGGDSYKGATFGAATLNAIEKKNAEAAAAAKNEAYNSGYNSAMGEVDGMIQAAISPIQQMYANMQSQQNAALQNANKLNQEQINSNYDNSAREYYRLYKTQQKQLPETLSRLGVTGGASESSQLKLLNSYSDNLYKNQSARNNQLAGVNADYNNQIAENSINAANTMANSYLQLAQQQLSYKRQDEQAEKEAKAEAQAAAEKSSLVSRNNKVRENEAARQRQGYTTTHWTDSDGYYHYQITGKKKTSSSGSSSKKKASVTYSGGSNSGSNSNNTVNTTKKSDTSYNDVLNQARMRLNYKAAGNNRITNQLYGATGALNYIINSGLSEAQQKKIAQELGLI